MKFFLVGNPYLWLAVGGILAGILGGLWFLSRKALPKRVVRSNTEFTVAGKQTNEIVCVRYKPKDKMLTIFSPQTPGPGNACNVSFSLYPISRRWTPSRNRKLGVGWIGYASKNVQQVVINGVRYRRNKNNRFEGPNGSDGLIREESRSFHIEVKAWATEMKCIIEGR